MKLPKYAGTSFGRAAGSRVVETDLGLSAPGSPPLATLCHSSARRHGAGSTENLGSRISQSNLCSEAEYAGL